jgi:hypothetical protein
MGFSTDWKYESWEKGEKITSAPATVPLGYFWHGNRCRPFLTEIKGLGE